MRPCQKERHNIRISSIESGIRKEKHMNIRRAQQRDLEGINRLLHQVEDVHQQGRPDLFKPGAKKYTDEELSELIRDDSRPIFVGVDEAENVLGYAFCIFEDHTPEHAMTDIVSLYIDDLCVEENQRGKHIGSRIYEYVVDYARKAGCYNITLNVWECNPAARKFYEAAGLVPYKTGMEKIL